jgi:type VI secretion system protein VasG
LVGDEELAREVHEISPEFKRIPPEQLRNAFTAIVKSSREEVGVTETESTAPGTAGTTKTPALDRYTTNLTEAAHGGRIDPVVACAAEIRQVVDVLMRRRQKNPILWEKRGSGEPPRWKASRFVWRVEMCPRHRET